MSNLELIINSQKYNYETIDDICKKFFSRIVDIKNIDEEEIDFCEKEKIIEGVFVANYNGRTITLEIRILIHFMIFGYFIELSENKVENENTFFSFIGNNIEYYNNLSKNMENVFLENMNKRKIYKVLSTLFEILEIIFHNLITNLEREERENILKTIIENFNLFSNNIDIILEQEDNFSVIQQKCYDEIEVIFEKIISENFENYNLSEVNIKYCFLLMIEDSLKAIYTCLLLDKKKDIEKIDFLFDSDLWFINFYSLLLSEYKNRKINLLKLNKNIDLLKYGMNISQFDKIIKRFSLENSVPEEIGPNLYYLILQKGYHNKTVYSFVLGDKNIEIDLFDKKLLFSQLNNNILVLDFANLILSSDSPSLKKSINDIKKILFEVEKDDFDDFIENLFPNFEIYIRNIFYNLEKNMLEKYEEMEYIFNISNKEEKRNIIYEFLTILLEKADISINSKKNILKNYKIYIAFFKNELNYEIRINKKKNIENKIYIQHNFIYKNKKNDKIFIDIDIDENLNEEDEKIEFLIYRRVYFIIKTFEKIRNNEYFFELNSKSKKIYFEILVDIICLLNIKEISFIHNFSLIKEYDYMETLLKKTETYFLALYLNDFDYLEKINYKVIDEAKELLDIFKRAIIDGYYYSTEDENIFDKDKLSEKTEILNYFIENLDLEDIFV